MFVMAPRADRVWTTKSRLKTGLVALHCPLIMHGNLHLCGPEYLLKRSFKALKTYEKRLPKSLSVHLLSFSHMHMRLV